MHKGGDVAAWEGADWIGDANPMGFLDEHVLVGPWAHLSSRVICLLV